MRVMIKSSRENENNRENLCDVTTLSGDKHGLGREIVCDRAREGKTELKRV
jgi:hypothetical protein